MYVARHASIFEITKQIGRYSSQSGRYGVFLHDDMVPKHVGPASTEPTRCQVYLDVAGEPLILRPLALPGLKMMPEVVSLVEKWDTTAVRWAEQVMEVAELTPPDGIEPIKGGPLAMCEPTVVDLDLSCITISS